MATPGNIAASAIERFSFECRNTKTMIGFGLASDWLSRWRKFFKPITEHTCSKAKPISDYFLYSIENRSIPYITVQFRSKKGC